MKSFCFVLSLSLIFFSGLATAADGRPSPFGMTVGETSYEQVRKHLDDRGWKYREYGKKRFDTISPNSPDRGKNTFILAEPKGAEGILNLHLFLGPDSVLDALMVNIDPKLFDVVMAQLDAKYALVKKNLNGEVFTANYPHVLWKAGGLYIELQRYSPHHVRLVYVSELYYENYRDFLYKMYEPYRRKQERRQWMDEL